MVQVFFGASHTAADDLPRFCLRCSFPPLHPLPHELAASWQQNKYKQPSNKRKTNRLMCFFLWQTFNCECRWLFYVNILGWLEVQKQTAVETVYVSQTAASSLLALTAVWALPEKLFHRFHWSIFFSPGNMVETKLKPTAALREWQAHKAWAGDNNIFGTDSLTVLK